jgi:hypothetical protein
MFNVKLPKAVLGMAAVLTVALAAGIAPAQAQTAKKTATHTTKTALGACTTKAGCQVTDQTTCTKMYGHWAGGGTKCPVVGACVTKAGCSLLDSRTCAAHSGKYMGDGTACK